MTMNVGAYNNNCNSTYNNVPDCYANSGYEHYQYHHHHYYQDQVYGHSDCCPTTNCLETFPKQYGNVAYYDSVLGYEHGGNNTSDLNESRRSEDSSYYMIQQEHYHHPDGGVNIITSSNGLSYTNLDYTNADNYGYHQKNTTTKEYVHYETLETKRESETRLQRHDESQENLDYLHQGAIPEEHYQSTAYSSSIKKESDYYQHATSSSLNVLPSDYHAQNLPLHHTHQNLHQHHQSTHVNAASATQNNVPTYKWMQVKRNVPKPGM